ncbi:MAG: hypothetical protein EHM48_10310 [Planctomycetaceae bacterium]|nr:MAG: hypothetical protein EHM48_10310 [Planctomycetaceae bacterium]
MKEIADTFPEAKKDWTDGVTVEFEDWWFNVRPSNTEPLLRLNLEAANAEMLKAKLKQVENLMGSAPVAH